MTKRISLLAGYDRDGVIHDYVVHMAKNLSRISEVYYCSDNELRAGEQIKLCGVAKICCSERHGKYDFGSWARMIDMIGWEAISRFDELIIANDSCYGPLFPIEMIHQHMCKYDCDFWGMTTNKEISFHVQSYYMVFNRKIILNRSFRNFWARVEPEDSYGDVVRKYELGLSRVLMNEGFVPAAYIDLDIEENITTFPLTSVKEWGMPFIKTKVFSDPYLASRERISLLFRYLRNKFPEIAAMISSHQGHRFLYRAMRVQASEGTIYVRRRIFAVRSIRGRRLKIVLFGKLCIFVRLPLYIIKKLSKIRVSPLSSKVINKNILH